MNVSIAIPRLWPQEYSPILVWVVLGPKVNHLYLTSAEVEFSRVTLTDCQYILYYMLERCMVVSSVWYSRHSNTIYSMHVQFRSAAFLTSRSGRSRSRSI